MHLPKCLERIVKTVAPLSAAALAAWPLRLPAEPPVEGHFRQLGGIVRFDNATPAILDRLGAPGNEGMSSLTVRATSLAPDAGLAAQVNAPVPSRVANPYQLSVQAGTNAATAIAYGVQAAIWLKNDRELFYSRIVETPPLVEARPLWPWTSSSAWESCGFSSWMQAVCPSRSRAAAVRSTPAVNSAARCSA